MNRLVLPLAALTFIPVNLGTLLSAAVNNFWAWLAVITAAFSFWRLRTPKTTSPYYIPLSPPPPPPPPSNSTPTTTTNTMPFKQKDKNEEEGEKAKEEEEGVLTRGNSKKSFTVYYYEEREIDQVMMKYQEEEDDDDDDDEMNGGHEVESESCCRVIKRWGFSTVEMRGGDLGWYSYQNRKVIDDSVVRLWGEERESGCCGSSPRSCPSRR